MSTHRTRRILSWVLGLLSVGASVVWAQDDASKVAPQITKDKDGRMRKGSFVYPTAYYQPDPEYSEEARKARLEGDVLVSFVVGVDGLTHDVKVVLPLGLGLDELAVEAVKTWKFEPGTKDDVPVAVKLQAEVSFHLLGSGIGQLDLVTDPMGVDFDRYLAAVLDRVSERWGKVKPEPARAAATKSGEVGVEFTIGKDGRVGSPQKIVLSSGDGELDKAAMEDIAAASPFQRLPTDFKGKGITLRMQFFFKEGGVVIAPSMAALFKGRTQQFSVSVGATKDPAATWSLSGPGCNDSACGTISASGLYTAPEEIPVNGRILRVMATLAGGHHLATTAVIHVLKGP